MLSRLDLPWPTADSGGGTPDPKVLDSPRRRHFSSKNKVSNAPQRPRRLHHSSRQWLVWLCFRPCPESIGLHRSSLRCLEGADADVENSTGFDQHSDAVHDDNTEYSNQERNEFFRNPLLVKHAESLSSRSRPVNHAAGTLWGKGE